MGLSDAYKPFPIYTELGEEFYDEVKAAIFPQHILRYRNSFWSQKLGFGQLSDYEWGKYFGNFEPLPNNLDKPLSLRYHGHQFRYYNPDLGDGRGFLYAQIQDIENNRILDLGTKGSGQTPWSRNGDGKLTLKGGVRELLATEMLEALGVYTSKTFSIIETGEQLYRNDEPSPTRSCVLVRLSHSHIRIGTFQRFAYLGETENIKKLIQYTTKYYYPDLFDLDLEQQTKKLFQKIVENCALLTASWMVVGFVHGVLNTDNINIMGESFDYGPYRFLPYFDPDFVAAYFDHSGLYSYGRQPEAVYWNLARLAETFIPLSNQQELENILISFSPLFVQAWRYLFFRRLGRKDFNNQQSNDLIEKTFSFLNQTKMPFEQFFFDWYGSHERYVKSPFCNLYQSDSFMDIKNLLHNHILTKTNVHSHDYFKNSICCSLVIEEIEKIWEAIDKKDDWSLLYNKIHDIHIMKKAYQFNPITNFDQISKDAIM
ncbi:MAG: YdiU family protein [Alphaproteobacteria bacterium]|nr:YdiU family protein [Alphaproteobacteria bacterium]